jgi:hypothetical protein
MDKLDGPYIGDKRIADILAPRPAVMDAEDGPECMCGRPATNENGECALCAWQNRLIKKTVPSNLEALGERGPSATILAGGKKRMDERQSVVASADAACRKCGGTGF